jgi:hypothetical protein
MESPKDDPLKEKDTEKTTSKDSQVAPKEEEPGAKKKGKHKIFLTKSPYLLRQEDQ